MANAVSSFAWLTFKYLPIIPGLVLIGYDAIRVEPYPSKIGVTHRSCADPANSGRLVFRQQSFCVTTAEEQEWATMWRIEYALMADVAVCWGLSRLARQTRR